MKLVKTFDSTELGKHDLFETFYDSVRGYFVEDGMTEYCVNEFVRDYENENDEGKKDYNLEEVEKVRKLDNYFISNGSNKDERIYVYHGTFDSKPWYIK